MSRRLIRSTDPDVTIELACRLLESKVLLRSEVAAALKDASVRGIALVQALIEDIPGALQILETEFCDWSGPVLTASLAMDEQLMRELPFGMCERLLALPLQRQPTTVAVPLAVVDPFDQHVLSEFAYCLSTAVSPVRVVYSEFVRALGAVHAAGRSGADGLLDVPYDETPALDVRIIAHGLRRETQEGSSPGSADAVSPARRHGVVVPSVDAPESVLDPPIPLMRPNQAPHATGSGRVDGPARERRDSEPVLCLVKQKPLVTMRRVSLPSPPRFAEYGVARPEEVLGALEQANSPRRLIELLREALERVAPSQAYFSVRGGRYALEWASGVERTAKTVLTSEQEAILEKACNTGYFLGPLPPDGSVRGLAAMLGLRARDEVYVAPVNVANRPALVVVVGRFDEAFAVTRWVDSVVARSGQVLERLARERKQP